MAGRAVRAKEDKDGGRKQIIFRHSGRDGGVREILPERHLYHNAGHDINLPGEPRSRHDFAMKAYPYFFGVALILSATSCDRYVDAKADAEWWRLEGERVGLVQQLELLKIRSARESAQLAELVDLRAEAGRIQDRLMRLKDELPGKREEISRLRVSVDEERLEWIDAARARAVGMRFDRLLGGNGKSYENVTITGVSAIGIEFRHREGLARLSAGDLSPRQRDLFGLDLNESLEARRREEESRLAFESDVDRAVASAKVARKAQEEARQLAQAESRRKRDLVRGTTRGKTVVATRLLEPPRRFGRARTPVSFEPYHVTPWPVVCSPVTTQPVFRVTSWSSAPPHQVSVCPPAVRQVSRPVYTPTVRRPILPD